LVFFRPKTGLRLVLWQTINRRVKRLVWGALSGRKTASALDTMSLFPRCVRVGAVPGFPRRKFIVRWLSRYNARLFDSGWFPVILSHIFSLELSCSS
jgi:hypothetical protein